jgi:hypothetical protein
MTKVGKFLENRIGLMDIIINGLAKYFLILREILGPLIFSSSSICHED